MIRETTHTNHSNQLNNMSCRPRTQVNSEKLPSKMLPETFKGLEVTIDLPSFIPKNLQKWVKENFYGKSVQTSALNALMNMGRNRQIRTYKRFIESTDKHEQEILNRLTHKTKLIENLPDVGVIIDRKSPKKNNAELDLQSALYFVSHSSGRIYLKNKSPLLSSIFHLYEDDEGGDSYFFKKTVTIKFLGGSKK